MDCVPSLTKSKMVLDSEITLGQSTTMEIHAFDDDGLEIVEARGRFFEVVMQAPSGKELIKRSQFKDKIFVVQFDHDDLASFGMYHVWVDGWNNGRSKMAHKYKVLAGSSDTLALPTNGRPHVLQVISTKVKKILASGLAVVIAASLGTAFLYVRRRNPGITKTLCSAI